MSGIRNHLLSSLHAEISTLPVQWNLAMSMPSILLEHRTVQPLSWSMPHKKDRRSGQLKTEKKQSVETLEKRLSWPIHGWMELKSQTVRKKTLFDCAYLSWGKETIKPFVVMALEMTILCPKVRHVQTVDDRSIDSCPITSANCRTKWERSSWKTGFLPS